MFPSPLGVIFSLIKVNKFSLHLEIKNVSVSSRSYILSYKCKKNNIENRKFRSFRLLSELYSLLYNQFLKNVVGLKTEGFRLLSELYSLLWVVKEIEMEL